MSLLPISFRPTSKSLAALKNKLNESDLTQTDYLNYLITNDPDLILQELKEARFKISKHNNESITYFNQLENLRSSFDKSIHHRDSLLIEQKTSKELTESLHSQNSSLKTDYENLITKQNNELINKDKLLQKEIDNTEVITEELKTVKDNEVFCKTQLRNAQSRLASYETVQLDELFQKFSGQTLVTSDSDMEFTITTKSDLVAILIQQFVSQQLETVA